MFPQCIIEWAIQSTLVGFLICFMRPIRRIPLFTINYINNRELH